MFSVGKYCIFLYIFAMQYENLPNVKFSFFKRGSGIAFTVHPSQERTA